MSLSIRGRMLLGFVFANTAVLAVAAALILNRPSAPPLIQGIYLSESRSLESFALLDHHGTGFSEKDLLGRWHLVSYGFTTCPDICPTTLTQLNQFTQQLDLDQENLRILFYTVDHRRDTVAQMSSYLPYFNADFIGLTHEDHPDNSHLPFEKSLGIVARLVTEEDTPEFQVLHGVHLFLINPQGQLQAIFKPTESSPGQYSFNPEQLAQDYQAIRRYQG
jgi:protein SCO1/2